MSGLTDEELNKRLHELVGLCWHWCKFHNPEYSKLSHYKCDKCGLNYVGNIDFTTSWEGFGILWEFMRKHTDWTKFCVTNGWYIPEIELNPVWHLPVMLISPYAFAKAVVDFFEDE